MINAIKRMFRKPTAIEIAVRDLEEHKRLLLSEQARAEYSAKVVEYHKDSIKRLSGYVSKGE